MGIKQLVQSAQRLLRKGSPTAASELLEENLATNASEPEALHLLARIRMLQGRTSDAVPLLKQALQLHSNKRRADTSTDRDSPVSAEVSPVDEASQPNIDAALVEDWKLIQTTAAEQQARRRIFDLEVESEADHDLRVIEEGRTLEGERPVVPVDTGKIGDPIPLQIKEEPRPEPVDDATGVFDDRSTVVDGELAVADNDLITSPRDDLAPIQGQIEFEFPDDGTEDEAQRRFEESLVLEADLESENRIDLQDGIEEPLDGTNATFSLPAVEESPDLDWEDFALDADDFEEAPTRKDLREVSAEGSVTRRQRAQQQALDLGREFAWDGDGVSLLTEVFDRYWWSQAKVSMRRELQAGMTPDELAIAIEVRDIWTDHPEFAMDLSNAWARSWGETTSAVYRNLSWPMSLALVRSAQGLQDIDCLEHFLCKLFDHWYTHRSLQRRCKSFNLYLFFRLGMARHELDLWPDWTFEPDEALGLELDDEHQPGVVTPGYRVLDRLGLVPEVKWTPRKRKCPPSQGRAEDSPKDPKTKSKSARSQVKRPDTVRSATQSRVAFVGNRIASTSNESKEQSRRNVLRSSRGEPASVKPARAQTIRGRDRQREPAEDFDW